MKIATAIPLCLYAAIEGRVVGGMPTCALCYQTHKSGTCTTIPVVTVTLIVTPHSSHPAYRLCSFQALWQTSILYMFVLEAFFRTTVVWNCMLQESRYLRGRSHFSMCRACLQIASQLKQQDENTHSHQEVETVLPFPFWICRHKYQYHNKETQPHEQHLMWCKGGKVRKAHVNNAPHQSREHNTTDAYVALHPLH